MTLIVGIYSMKMRSTKKDFIVEVGGSIFFKKEVLSVNVENKRWRIQQPAVHQVLGIFLLFLYARYYYFYFIFEKTEARLK